MKLEIAVCDDLNEERVKLGAMIRDYCSRRNLDAEIQLFSSGDELLTAFRSGMFHILFLDIYMPGTNGVDTARRIREQDQTCSILFATTSQDHGVDSYEVQASDYLVKPFRAEEVAEALDWCIAQTQSTYRGLRISCDSGTVHMPLRDLHYIEIQGYTAYLHTEDGVLATRRGLEELEQEIAHSDFLRCHRSFLVNMNCIKWIEKNSFQLYSGDMVPIGSTIAAKVKHSFMNWSFVKAWKKKS